MLLGDGTGGESIYGEKFNDENFQREPHDKYHVGMANAGPNTNSSKFFITTDVAGDDYIIVGKVIDGLEFVWDMTQYGIRSGKTADGIIIVNCGQL
ncbi:unnamed protein product [Auanema sp. JU1783]|nr:unnamed protein product [Auanema sp. JU1783]